MTRPIPNGLYTIAFGPTNGLPPHPADDSSDTYRTLDDAKAAVGLPNLRWRHTDTAGHAWDAVLPDGRRVLISEALGVVGVDTSDWPRHQPPSSSA